MQTSFTSAQLRDPRIREANDILRKCVHCGFCTATCPTYLELGEENDSPRGRIYLLRSLLEGTAEDPAEVARHMDRCLTCLSCMTTCPSGVDYNHLLETGRARLEEMGAAARPLPIRLWRWLLNATIPHPGRLAMAVSLARPFAGLARVLDRHSLLRPAAAMLRMACQARAVDRPLSGVFPARNRRRGRIALLQGCAQSVIAAHVNRATIDLATRAGYDVIIPEAAGCCGALTLHMGREEDARALARRNITAWLDAEVEAVIVNASGCGVTVKDYDHLFRFDAEWRERANRIAAMSRDVNEWLAGLDLPELAAPEPLVVALHLPCSLQHGQRILHAPRRLLEKAGFTVTEPAESHICCGAAGVYAILEPEIATRLQTRKAGHLAATGADVIASANFGCMHHIAEGTRLPVVHVVELLAWAAGGPPPPALASTPLPTRTGSDHDGPETLP